MSESPPPDSHGWHSRGYLPHLNLPGVTQALTFHLGDSLPSSAIERMRSELEASPPAMRAARLSESINTYLDAGHGAAFLADPEAGTIVEDAFLHFDGERYRLHAWVVMPNHIHVVLSPIEPWLIADIVYSWKRFTARRLNALRGTSGRIWQRDYFDRVIRSDRHFEAAVTYAEFNPVQVGLCKRPEDWRFSSARRR